MDKKKTPSRSEIVRELKVISELLIEAQAYHTRIDNGKESFRVNKAKAKIDVLYNTV